MKKIAITGGIGSGKSYLSHKIQDHYREYETICGKRIFVYDLDAVAKLAMLKYKQNFKCFFGNDFYTDKGDVNKDFIIHNIMESKEKYDRLNLIVSNLVILILNEYWEYVPYDAIIFLETAILFECGMKDFVDDIILVYADTETRIERILKRGNMNIDTIQKILNLQQPDEEKLEKCNYVIANGSDCLQFDSVADNLIKKIIGESSHEGYIS